jgi:hypothetical protein
MDTDTGTDINTDMNVNLNMKKDLAMNINMYKVYEHVNVHAFGTGTCNRT